LFCTSFPRPLPSFRRSRDSRWLHLGTNKHMKNIILAASSRGCSRGRQFQLQNGAVGCLSKIADGYFPDNHNFPKELAINLAGCVVVRYSVGPRLPWGLGSARVPGHPQTLHSMPRYAGNSDIHFGVRDIVTIYAHTRRNFCRKSSSPLADLVEFLLPIPRTWT
jgi:hypothetical protein